MENKGSFGRVTVFCFEEGIGMVTPVTAGVEMMGSVVAIVETKAIALFG